MQQISGVLSKFKVIRSKISACIDSQTNRHIIYYDIHLNEFSWFFTSVISACLGYFFYSQWMTCCKEFYLNACNCVLQANPIGMKILCNLGNVCSFCKQFLLSRKLNSFNGQTCRQDGVNPNFQRVPLSGPHVWSFMLIRRREVQSTLGISIDNCYQGVTRMQHSITPTPRLVSKLTLTGIKSSQLWWWVYFCIMFTTWLSWKHRYLLSKIGTGVANREIYDTRK